MVEKNGIIIKGVGVFIPSSFPMREYIFPQEQEEYSDIRILPHR